MVECPIRIDYWKILGQNYENWKQETRIKKKEERRKTLVEGVVWTRSSYLRSRVFVE